MTTLFFQKNKSNFFSTIVLFILVFLIPNIGHTQKDLKPIVPIDSLDKVFAGWNDLNKPGIAVGVLSNGKLVHTKGYGSANLESGIPVTPNTKFYIGEIAREFIAFSMLLLEEQGKLSLQDDILKYLPELPNYKATVTISQLINQTSGLTELSTIKAISGWQHGDQFSQKNAMTLLASQAQLNAIPGKQQQYINTVYVLLEAIAAKVTGLSYPAFVQENIFDPLKMTNTVFADTPSKIIPNRAQGYHPDGEGFQNAIFDYATVGPTSLFSTVEDMCKWAANFRTPTVGNRSMIQQMETPTKVNGKQVSETNAALYFGQYNFWNYSGTRKIYHIGGGNGFASKLIRNPDQDVAVIILGNSSPYNGYAATGVIELYVKKYFPTPSPATAANQSTSTPTIKLSTKQLENFVGDYWFDDGYYSRNIYLKNDTIRYFRRPGNESLLAPINDHTFKMLPYDIRVQFKTEKSGEKTLSFIRGDEAPVVGIYYAKEAPWTKDLTAFTGTYICKEIGAKYNFRVKDGKLVATHNRLDDVVFEPNLKDMFAGNEEHFSQIQFQRNANSNVKGFQLTAPGISDLWFEKVSDVTSAMK